MGSCSSKVKQGEDHWQWAMNLTPRIRLGARRGDESGISSRDQRVELREGRVLDDDSYIPSIDAPRDAVEGDVGDLAGPISHDLAQPKP
jgi:hypothetical protein